jgi:hypothetical protein
MQGLGVDSYKLKWYVQAELMNARTAMLAVAGILYQELIGDIGIGGPAANVAWFDAGKQEYFAPASTLFIVQMVLFGWVEMRRFVQGTCSFFSRYYPEGKSSAPGTKTWSTLAVPTKTLSSQITSLSTVLLAILALIP